jgi:hypothetical protein
MNGAFFQKSPMKTVVLWIFVALVFGSQARAADNWGWKAKPTKSKWKDFFALSTPQQEALIGKSRNPRFNELHWEWRLAWVRACGQGNGPACGQILQLGLFDKALVVRAEAANRVGNRFAGSGHPPAIRILRTAYGIQKNQRNGTPLFVQYRILHALNRIGGDGVKVGRELAMNLQPTRHYWSKIAVQEGRRKKGPQ